MNPTDSTIVAISSPPGRSLRGLVRVSGPKVMAILGRLLSPPNSPVDQLRAWPRPYHLARARIHLPSAPRGVVEISRSSVARHEAPSLAHANRGTQSNEPADAPENASRPPTSPLTVPVWVAMFSGPKSFTGQDTAEIQCPGNPSLMHRIVDWIMELGAERAEAGEFTYRAFLAQKIDLTQAEGVAATISAANSAQLQAAGLLRRGELGRVAQRIVDALADLLALVEAGIDFTDQEDVVPIAPGQLHARLRGVSRSLTGLLERSRSWGAIEATPRVVLVGPPSTGKSTLFNALLGQGRAVTSPAAGTTRDVIAEALVLQAPGSVPVEVLLTDLAGLDTPLTALDRKVQSAARSAIEKADLVLLIDDLSPRRPTSSLASLANHAQVLRVRTKADLIEPATTWDESGPGQHGWEITVSAHTGKGIASLKQAIARRLADRAVSISGEMLVLQPRHELALRTAAEDLHAAEELVARQLTAYGIGQVELVATTLRSALNVLGEIGGRTDTDDIIGRVFSQFCVGK